MLCHFLLLVPAVLGQYDLAEYDLDPVGYPSATQLALGKCPNVSDPLHLWNLHCLKVSKIVLTVAHSGRLAN